MSENCVSHPPRRMIYINKKTEVCTSVFLSMMKFYLLNLPNAFAPALKALPSAFNFVPSLPSAFSAAAVVSFPNEVSNATIFLLSFASKASCNFSRSLPIPESSLAPVGAHANHTHA